MSLLHRLLIAGMALPGITSAPLWAQTTEVPANGQAASDTFQLGTIYLGTDEEGQGGSTATVTGEETWRQSRQTLDDALGILPGVSSISSGGGSRNEREVFVRGFDRWHVPLSIDGIRIFLPADNRLDFGRFLTPDLSEVQVQKGYVSVLNGPGGMGGAINLVTKTPTKPFEGEARLGAEVGNRGDIAGRTGYLSLGTRHELWYAQASYMRRESDGFYLSRDFVAVPQEDGGLRDNSDSSDDRLNVKFGYTPNATDEYVLSYTKQTGSKNAPYDTVQTIRLPLGSIPGIGGTQRDWTWPQWDISSLAFYSHTELEQGYLKTKVYYNTFDNILSAWDNSAHNSQSVIAGRIFDSVYDDHSVGASLEYGLTLGQHELKFATHYRRDVHLDTQYPSPGAIPRPAAKATERSEEETISLAVEDTWHIREDLRIVGGLSYDRAEIKEAKRTATDPGYDPLDLDAVNWQLAAIWSPEMSGEFHASLSSRTAFPTMFHRYSTRFGSFDPNPDLQAERATNLELGYSGEVGAVQLAGAVFYSRVEDLIQAVYLRTETTPAVPPATTPTTTDIMQQQNVGKGVFKGAEIAARWQVNNRIMLSGNYTYLDASIDDPSIAGLRITDIPKHKLYLQLDWQALDRLTVSPSVEIYAARWSDPAAGQPRGISPTYVYEKMGGYGLANLGLSWQANDQVAVDFGMRNIFDRNVMVVDGFPEAGRSFYLTTQIKF